ncbi:MULTISPECIES: hypothetical protein [unclassified Janthinobacterium]|jgi:hypothetical protein|uniref:hypothetical protein n=1 Tax=unclassified Janthinobacterium TaxID=2610881 RepID=UPI0018CA0B94|nr:hypothetical protein [Janthinobacterium sp. CG_23.4]
MLVEQQDFGKTDGLGAAVHQVCRWRKAFSYAAHGGAAVWQADSRTVAMIAYLMAASLPWFN